MTVEKREFMRTERLTTTKTLNLFGSLAEGL
jgi:hypothetical protein